MSPEIAGLLGIGMLLFLIAVGFSFAFAGAITGFLGLWFLAGQTPAFTMLGAIPYSTPATYALTTIPLFVIMGYFTFNAGLATQAFETFKRWLGHIPGGIAMATVIACAAFGACTGASVAAAAVFAKVAIPEMEKLGYKPGLAASLVAACGPFASMIPPSGLMVMYAIMAQASVGKCLIAGLIPGVMLATIYALYLFIRIKRNPSLAGGILPVATWRERLVSVPPMWGVFVMALVIIGGIFFGIFTPTEAAAIGAAVGLIMVLVNKNIRKWPSISKSMLETGRTTAMIFFIFIGVLLFANFLTLSNLTSVIVSWITSFGLNRYLILISFVIIYIVGGMFLNSTSLLLLSMPIIFPIVMKLGFNPIWYGVLIIQLLEIGMITPPVAMTIFVVHGVAKHIPIEDMYRNILPFVIIDLAFVVLLIIFPEIALFLPNLM